MSSRQSVHRGQHQPSELTVYTTPVAPQNTALPAETIDRFHCAAERALSIMSFEAWNVLDNHEKSERIFAQLRILDHAAAGILVALDRPVVARSGGSPAVRRIATPPKPMPLKDFSRQKKIGDLWKIDPLLKKKDAKNRHQKAKKRDLTHKQRAVSTSPTQLPAISPTPP